MRRVKIQLRLPEDSKDEAMRQAEMSGARTTLARAKALLNRLGTTGNLREDGHLDAPDEGAQRPWR
jgi:hypothetical protein